MNIFSHFSSSSDGGWELRDRHERKTLHFILAFPYAHLRALYVPAKNKTRASVGREHKSDVSVARAVLKCNLQRGGKTG